MNNLPQKPYRLEERRRRYDGSELVVSANDYDDRQAAEADLRFEVRVSERFTAPDAGRPAPYRLVLLGPDRTTQPTARGERRAEPGEVCTCGRPAVRVFTGGPWGDTGYCGLPDGGRRRPCPWCDGPGHDGQRCPQYRIVPAVK